MDPNAREPGSMSGTTIADKPINPVSGIIPEPSVAVASSNVGPDMHVVSDLERLVNAAKEQVPTDSQNAFVQQFGQAEGAAPVSQPTPVVEPPIAEVPSVDQQVAGHIPQTAAEIVSQPEQTPAEKLKEQIAASVDEFLSKVTEEKVAA